MRTALLTLMLVALAGSAAAQEQEFRPNRVVIPEYAPPEPPPRREKSWYGVQTMVVDFASTTMFIVAARTKESGWGQAAMLSYGLGAPTVHWAHGHAGRGFGSLGLRVAFPVAGAIGTCMMRVTDMACGWPGAIAGGLAAMVIDAVRATEYVEVSPKAGFTIAPTASIARNNALLGIHGAF